MTSSASPSPDRARADGRREGLDSPVEGFNERARRAIADDSLHDAIALTTERLTAGRDAALGALPQAASLRERAYRIKQRTMADLDRYLEQMADAVSGHGGHVHFASSGADVARYIGELAERRGARLIVKSKSMASEEIELNRRLEEAYAGLEIVETDLGEWIAQIAGDHPSHTIAPILHMNRHQVAETLATVAGRPLPPDPGELMRFARERLRQKFLTADIGITGANFGVAETGTVVLVTNEGNGRLVSSVPPVHVVLMGIEKLVPRLEDLSVFLRLLARSGTGQKLSAYTSFVTGPRRAGELDGPEELHLILMDNGRSRLLGTDFEEALYCIRCGACSNVCPVYRQTGGHAYGSTYSGPIGAVITPLLKGQDEARDLPYASSLCGACSEVCPVGIPLADLLLRLRERQVQSGLATRGERIANACFARTMTSPAAYRSAAAAARIARGPLAREGVGRSLPGPLGAWTGSRDLPPVAAKSFRQLWSEGI